MTSSGDARTYHPSPVNAIGVEHVHWQTTAGARGPTQTCCGGMVHMWRRGMLWQPLVGYVPPASPVDGSRHPPIAFTAEAGEALAKNHGVWRQERLFQRMHQAFPTTRIPGMLVARGQVCG